MKKTEVKTYEIKVPVYISESNCIDSDLFFFNYQEMTQTVKSAINKQNEIGQNIICNKHNTTKTKEINTIEYFEHVLGDIPVLLIKMDVSTKNYTDVYVHKDEEVLLGENDKIGSKNNWLLLYPRIIGLDPKTYSYHWLIFVYADPNKEFKEVTSTAKLFLSKVLGVKYRNVKTSEVLTELRKMGDFISKLQINYTSITSNDNDTNLKLINYLVKGQLKKEAEVMYEHVPFEETRELLNDDSHKKWYQKRVIKIIQGKKEYKITTKEQINEVSSLMTDVVEETFNMKCNITEEDLKSNIIFNEQFIIKSLKPIIENYLESYVK